MIRIAWDQGFGKIYRKKVRNDALLKQRFWKAMELFSRNPFHPRLRTHKLSGKLEGLWGLTKMLQNATPCGRGSFTNKWTKGEQMRAQGMEEKEEVVIEKFRRLSREKKEEVLDFLEFLESREKVRAWLEFDAWAINLAKQKGFYQLTDDDIARIVSDFRSSKS